MGNKFSKMKNQTKMLQEQMEKMQQDLKNKRITGSVANDLVTVTIDGEKEIKKIKIDPKCVDPNDLEGLEDLIMAAFKNAYEKLDVSNTNDPSLNNLFGF